MADIDYEKLGESVAKAIRGDTSAPKSSTDLNIDSLKAKFGNLVGEVSPLVIGFNRLTTGATAAETALQAIGKVSSLIPGLSGFGSAIGEAGMALLKNKSQMDEAGKMGLGGNNLGLYNQQVAQLGVTTTEYNQLMKNYGNNINGLAGSAQRSGEMFAKLGSDVRDSGTGRQLQQLGVSTEELAQITALSAINGKKLAAQGTEDYKKQTAAAQELAQQITETSLITGMNREAITKSVEAETKKPGVMLAMLQMDQDQKNSFLKTQSQLASLGPSVQSLASEIVTGGVRTKEGIATMTALGPAGEELQRAVKLQQGLSADASAEQKRQAKEAVDMATAKVNERIASKEFAQIANTATGETASQMLKIASENKGVQTQMAAVAEANGDLAKATKAQREEAQLRIGGYKVDDQGRGVASGQKDKDGQDILLMEEGNRLSRTLNDANARGAIQAEGLARNFKLANDEIGKSPDAIRLFNTLLRGAGTATTGEQAQKDQKPVFDKINTRKDAEPAAPGYKGVNQPIEDLVGKAPKKADGGIVPGTDTGTTVTVGEKGAPEAIVPLDALRGMMESKSGGINIAEISKTISTTLSSASSPNEGPKVVQNDESKAASRELANVKAQYAAEREVLLQKTKAELGPDAGPRQVRNAMRDSDEGKAIEEKYKALKAPLYKQIEDGISWETAKKSQQAEETIASLKEQESTGYAANRAAALARDALEEKAELEGRAMTQSEEAQYKLLGIELNASSDKITAAQNAQKEFERSQQAETVAAKSAAFEKINAVEIAASAEENINQAGLVDTVKAAQEEFKVKIETSKQAVEAFVKSTNMPKPEEIKSQMEGIFSKIGGAGGKPEEIKSQMEGMFSKLGGAGGMLGTNMPKPEEIKSQMEGMFSKLGGAGGMLGDMFNPKIIDTKLAESNKAKLAEVKKEEPKPAAPAPKPAEKPAESKPANNEIGIKDLNDQLKMLNMNMLKLIDHSETISGASEKTAKNSAKATGNRYA